MTKKQRRSREEKDRVYFTKMIHKKVNNIDSDVYGIRHIQLNKSLINPNNPKYYHIDAVYIGIDKVLRFLTSSKEGNIVIPMEVEDIETNDLRNLYYNHI